MAILVTGGSSGIGRAIAERLAKPGTDVFLNYHSNDGAAEEAAASIRKLGAYPHLIRADIGTRQGIHHIFDEVSRVTPSLETIVHAAAMAVSGRIIDMDPDLIDRAVATNGTSLVHLAQAARPFLGRGSNLVFVTSGGAERALKGYGGLGGPKALGQHFARYLATELAAEGIRVNSVSPGPLDTQARRDMFPETWKTRLQDQAAANPSGHGLEFADVAGVVELMCRPEFQMVQGQIITIDGGLTL
jgi:enoyl-[acyl-carrier protein] reductase III